MPQRKEHTHTRTSLFSDSDCIISEVKTEAKSEFDTAELWLPIAIIHEDIPAQ